MFILTCDANSIFSPNCHPQCQMRAIPMHVVDVLCDCILVTTVSPQKWLNQLKCCLGTDSCGPKNHIFDGGQCPPKGRGTLEVAFTRHPLGGGRVQLSGPPNAVHTVGASSAVMQAVATITVATCFWFHKMKLLVSSYILI